MTRTGSEPGRSGRSPVPVAPPDPRLAGHLDAAVRVAARFRGHVEPNPLVGCTILDSSGRRVAVRGHERFGGPHAEVLALEVARGAARGGTAIVTLEPCDHHGKQPPCTAALLEAGVARVIFAVADPNPEAAGGAERLRAAGIEVATAPWHHGARRLMAPFVHRVRTGRPWVVAKWAQTVDGFIATRTGQSQWISGPISRRLVHRERGRTPAILTGIGTILADDPRLDPRDVRVRRRPHPIIADPDFRTPPTARCLQTGGPRPIIAGRLEVLERGGPEIAALGAMGAELLGLPATPGGIDLAALLAAFTGRGLDRVLVEAGSGLVGGLLAADLVQEAWVFSGPRLLADREAMSPAGRPAASVPPATIDAGIPMRLLDLRRRGEDALMHWLVGSAATGDAEAEAEAAALAAATGPTGGS